MIAGLAPSPARRRLCAALITVFLTAACSKAAGPTPAPSPPAGAKTAWFRSSDGVSLTGERFGNKGSVGVVLAHQYNADQSTWFGFAPLLAANGYRVLTFNFRGFCTGAASGAAACSGTRGKSDPAKAPQDLDGAIAYIRSQGAKKVFVIGASMGGTAAMNVALQQHLAGVVTLSAPVSFMGLDAHASAAGRTPKLFIAGKDDPFGGASGAHTLYAQAPARKQLLIVPSDQHGAFLLSDDLDPSSAGQVRKAILQFLALYRGV